MTVHDTSAPCCRLKQGGNEHRMDLNRPGNKQKTSSTRRPSDSKAIYLITMLLSSF